MDRRTFVAHTTCTLAAVAAGGCASLVTVPVVPEGGVIRLTPASHPSLSRPGGWLKVLPASWSSPLYVLALEDGSYAAVLPICTHLGCTVDISGLRLVCPCHGSTYDREGNVLRGPAERALQRFPTQVTGAGEIIVAIGGMQ